MRSSLHTTPLQAAMTDDSIPGNIGDDPSGGDNSMNSSGRSLKVRSRIPAHCGIR
jgi:hypothetical protein